MAGIMEFLSSVLGGNTPQQTQQARPSEVVSAEAERYKSPQNAVPAGIQSIFGMPADEFKNRLRAAAAGMATESGAHDSKWSAIAKGFGGAQKYFSDQEAATAKLQREQEKLDYERALAERKADVDQRQWDAEHDLRKRNDARQQQTTEMGLEKSKADIAKTKADTERLARTKGLSTGDKIQIERLSQAAAENERDPEKRALIIETERARLTREITGADAAEGNAGQTLSGGSALSGGERTATGPNGEKLILRNGTWEPLAR
ncbi:MAG TPA: hypothetical protein VGN93_13310 [Shinella sp.]|jgi:hypothetical protein|uniref:hypothetical protein n=1 Tax=Shinella sp. TaxID=1870904 RepID=UPI002E0D6692|nr:hypothetical protein [Shinella sp.]